MPAGPGMAVDLTQRPRFDGRHDTLCGLSRMEEEWRNYLLIPSCGSWARKRNRPVMKTRRPFRSGSGHPISFQRLGSESGEVGGDDADALAEVERLDHLL